MDISEARDEPAADGTAGLPKTGVPAPVEAPEQAASSSAAGDAPLEAPTTGVPGAGPGQPRPSETPAGPPVDPAALDLPPPPPADELAGPEVQAAAHAPVEPPAIPPVVDVQDFDWQAVRAAVDPPAVRSRIRPIVEGMETLLDRAGGPGMLFDADRAGPEDQVIRVSGVGAGPLWIIGDLHGDLLALEAALALIRDHAAGRGEGEPRIIFLGDLFDDEQFSLEVLLRVFELIVDAPERVCVIAGNHDEALSFDGVHFASSVDPSDFSDYLNAHLSHEWIERAGKLAVRFFAQAPRALFFPDGLLISHGGFPLTDLHARLAETGNWNDPACLSDFVWTRAHPTARKKLPNRFSRGSQYGYEDFAAFCSLSVSLGRPVTHIARGHDHVPERYAIYPAYREHPILTTVALSRRLNRDPFGPYERVPTIARVVDKALPQVYRLHIPPEMIREIFPPPDLVDDGDGQTDGEART